MVFIVIKNKDDPLPPVPPQKPVIKITTYDEKNSTIRIPAKNPQLFDQDGRMWLECEVAGGSPPPRVLWRWNGQVDDTYQRRDYLTVNKLDLTTARRELFGSQLVCEARNTHLIKPVTTEIMIDLNRE